MGDSTVSRGGGLPPPIEAILVDTQSTTANQHHNDDLDDDIFTAEPLASVQKQNVSTTTPRYILIGLAVLCMVMVTTAATAVILVIRSENGKNGGGIEVVIGIGIWGGGWSVIAIVGGFIDDGVGIVLVDHVAVVDEGHAFFESDGLDPGDGSVGDFSRGKNEYPTTLVGAYQLLLNYNVDGDVNSSNESIGPKLRDDNGDPP
jgi:hypothetical protein